MNKKYIILVILLIPLKAIFSQPSQRGKLIKTTITGISFKGTTAVSIWPDDILLNQEKNDFKIKIKSKSKSKKILSCINKLTKCDSGIDCRVVIIFEYDDSSKYVLAIGNEQNYCTFYINNKGNKYNIAYFDINSELFTLVMEAMPIKQRKIKPFKYKLCK